MLDDQDHQITETRDFVITTLPRLATHYRRQELLKVEKTYDWLKSFISKEPDLDDARKAFFQDGSRCIDALGKYLELASLAVGNLGLTLSCGPIYVKFLGDFYQRIDPEQTDMSNDMMNAICGNSIHNLITEVQALRKLGYNEVFMQAADEICDDYNSNVVFTLDYRGIAEVVWGHIYRTWERICGTGAEADADEGLWRADANHPRVPIEKDYKLNSRLSIQEALQIMENEYDGYIRESEELACINRNIRDLVYHVGCPEAHKGFQRNVAELRKFHATQMPFFAKLQIDLQAQIKLNDEQREIITALVFRHLIEHLPPNPYKNRTNATDRWLAFWEDAVRTEYVRPINHPLKGLVNEKVFTPLSDPLVESSTKQPVTRNSTGQSVDRDFIKGRIDEVGEKAQMYRLGKDLFGTMSKNIHAYEAKGKGGYKIGSHHWGKGVRDILERLVPVEYARDDADNDAVDWERERLRYVPADGIVLTTEAEVPGKPGEPGTPAQPYDGKLNGYT